jgi:hypothetical protein
VADVDHFPATSLIGVDNVQVGVVGQLIKMPLAGIDGGRHRQTMWKLDEAGRIAAGQLEEHQPAVGRGGRYAVAQHQQLRRQTVAK